MARRERRRGGAHSAKRNRSAKRKDRTKRREGFSFGSLPGMRREDQPTEEQTTASELLAPSGADPGAPPARPSAPPLPAAADSAPTLPTAADYGAPWDEPAETSSPITTPASEPQSRLPAAGGVAGAGGFAGAEELSSAGALPSDEPTADGPPADQPTADGPPADGPPADEPGPADRHLPVPPPRVLSAPTEPTEEPPAAAGSEKVTGDFAAPVSRRQRRAARKGKLKPDKKDRSEKRKKKKAKRSWLDRVLLAAVVLVALALVAVGSGYAYLQYRFDQVAKVAVKHLTRAPSGQPFNVLLIGSDTRAGLSTSDQAHFGGDTSAGGQRSDVVKIMHVIPATGEVRILSIPRDTMVTIAGNTNQTGQYNRINATYGVGPDQLVQTIQTDFGIPIEHTVQLDFVGFRGAVDAIGGINLDFPYPARDTYTGLNITAPGCQHLNGGYSLAVARSRHYQFERNGYWQYDGTSDFGRIQRQNAFLKALINQAESRYNPLTLNAFLGSVVQGVTIDSTFSVSELISLAREFHTFASQSLATATLPTYSTYSSRFASLGDVLYVQQPQASQVIEQFLGQAPEPAFSPPPGPYGSVPSTTTTSTTTSSVPHSAVSSGSTPATSATSSTTTTIETDFDPTPC